MSSADEGPMRRGETPPVPGTARPDRLDPGRVDPGHLEPGHLQPGHLEPGHLEPGHLEPGHLQPGHLQPGQTWPGPSGGAVIASEDPPRNAGDALSWLLFAIAGFAVGQVFGYIILVLVASVSGHLNDYVKLAAQSVPPAWVVVSELVGLWIGFLGAVFAAAKFRGTGSVVRDMGLRFKPWDFVIGPVVGFLGQVVLVPILYLPLDHLNPHIQRELSQPAERLTGGFHGGNLVIIGVLTVVVVPFVEELLFRGLLLRSLLKLAQPAGRVVGPAIAIVLTGILFGLAHFEPLQLLGLSAFGCVLAFLAYRLRRLGAGILAHATFNLVAVLAIASSSAVH